MVLEVQNAVMLFLEFSPGDLVELTQTLSQYASSRGDVYSKNKQGQYAWHTSALSLVNMYQDILGDKLLL